MEQRDHPGQPSSWIDACLFVCIAHRFQLAGREVQVQPEPSRTFPERFPADFKRGFFFSFFFVMAVPPSPDPLRACWVGAVSRSLAVSMLPRTLTITGTARASWESSCSRWKCCDPPSCHRHHRYSETLEESKPLPRCKKIKYLFFFGNLFVAAPYVSFYGYLHMHYLLSTSK